MKKNSIKLTPSEGVKLLENKKVLGTDAVYSVVEQHHEYMDGTGYPKGLVKEKIHPLARLCQIADELDEMTSIKENKEVLSPNVALESLINNNKTPSGGERLDRTLLEQIASLF